jgi:hypothetical protein
MKSDFPIEKGRSCERILWVQISLIGKEKNLGVLRAEGREDPVSRRACGCSCVISENINDSLDV